MIRDAIIKLVLLHRNCNKFPSTTTTATATASKFSSSSNPNDSEYNNGNNTDCLSKTNSMPSSPLKNNNTFYINKHTKPKNS